MTGKIDQHALIQMLAKRETKLSFSSPNELSINESSAHKAAETYLHKWNIDGIRDPKERHKIILTRALDLCSALLDEDHEEKQKS